MLSGNPAPAGERDAALVRVSYGAGLLISAEVGLDGGAIRMHESRGRTEAHTRVAG